MQNKNQVFFVDRAVFYLSRAISAQGEKGRIWKYGINSVIGIFITQFRVFDNDDVLSEMKLIDPKTNKMVSDKMHGYFIQLPKFKKSNNGCVDHFDEWIYNLKNMERMGNIEFKDQEVFERLWNLSNCSMLSIDERRKYERSLKAYRDYVNQMDFARAEGKAEGREEGREEGRAEGREEGKTEERFKIISTLKRKGKSDEEIASLLDLDIEDVKSV